MIRVERRELETPLAEKTKERAATLRQHLDEGTTPPDSLLAAYRDPPLKVHLVDEAHGKCIYCESKVTHVYFGDIEHLRPKSVFPAHRLDVDNLGLACAVCNGAKGEYWDDAVPLLDPYVDDPNVEFLSLGFSIGRRPGRDRARITLDRLQLNRPGLVERRKEHVEMLQPLADQYVLAPAGAIKDLLREELCRYAKDSGEYAFVVRAYLRAACDLVCDQAA